MRAHLGVDSLKFVSLDGLYRACGGRAAATPRQPQFCDACFSGDYPVRPSDMIEQGFELKVAGVSRRPRRSRWSPARAAASASRSPRALGAARRAGRSPWRAPSAGSRRSPTPSRPPAAPTPTLVPLSITDEGGLQRLCLAIHERWGRLDLAVHCAAHAPPLAPAPHIADQDFDQSVEVNLQGHPAADRDARSRCCWRRPPAASSMSPTTAPASRSSAPTAPPRPPPRRWCAPGPPRPPASAPGRALSTPTRCRPRCAPASSPARTPPPSPPAPTRPPACWTCSPPRR